MTLVEIKGLSIQLPVGRKIIHAVRNVDLMIERGTIHGLIGESGCGKTVTGMSMLGLLPENMVLGAEKFLFDGINMTAHAADLRGRRIGMISQDPSASLNPLLTIGKQMDDVLRYAANEPRSVRRDKAAELLLAAGLNDPKNLMLSYPHQLSGGMQQRVVIAQALATGAEFLIADEPTTALDVTVEQQVLEQLQMLVAERNLTVLMITHDMSVIARTCNRVSILYAGTTVEEGPTQTILASPRHPYTRGLLSALPSAGTPGEPLASIPGSVPPAINQITGCAFAARCPVVQENCETVPALLRGYDTHWWYCHQEGGHV